MTKASKYSKFEETFWDWTCGYNHWHQHTDELESMSWRARSTSSVPDFGFSCLGCDEDLLRRWSSLVWCCIDSSWINEDNCPSWSLAAYLWEKYQPRWRRLLTWMLETNSLRSEPEILQGQWPWVLQPFSILKNINDGSLAKEKLGKVSYSLIRSGMLNVQSRRQ